eukprot:1136703-Pelagomonas_calceolata.AAC.1
MGRRKSKNDLFAAPCAGFLKYVVRNGDLVVESRVHAAANLAGVPHLATLNPYIKRNPTERAKLQEEEPYRKRNPTERGTLQKEEPYRKRNPTERGTLQKEEPYRKRNPTERGTHGLLSASWGVPMQGACANNTYACDCNPWYTLSLLSWPSAITLATMSITLELGRMREEGA